MKRRTSFRASHVLDAHSLRDLSIALSSLATTSETLLSATALFPSLKPSTDPVMDFGSSINEAEDPGASPWGNSPASSPRQVRGGLGNIGEEASTTQFRFSAQSSNGLNQDPSAPEGFQRPGTATTASGTDGETDESTTLESPLPEPAESQASVAESSIAGAESEQAASQQEPSRPAQPQFKLQAKISGLERTGKKDPILRFDVHVGFAHSH